MKPIILLGITGGIAAVKVPSLIERLTKRYTLRVIMTPSARKIVSITGRSIYTDLFPEKFDPKHILANRRVEHIDLADSADLFVIVPATANVIAKLAHGMADDYITTTALAVTCPIIVCPSMNVHMWQNPVTRQNIEKLRAQGKHIAGPDSGMLACGYTGEGRLIDIEKLTETIASFTSLRKPLAGKNVLVSAGATIEPIDDVRVMTNKSSGKMGVAIAQAALLAGANVLLLRSTTSVSPRLAVKEELFDTAESLEILMKHYCPNMDIVIHAAAVSDFAIKNRGMGKTSSKEPLALELEPRKKILESIKTYNPKVFLVAFKAEWNVSNELLATLAKNRLARAHADLIIANDVGRANVGFQSDDNEVFVIDKRGRIVHLARASKSIIAERIIRFL